MARSTAFAGGGGAVNGELRELLGTLRAFAIPMRTKFRGITVREGALIQGPAGWGEFSPFAEYGPRESARWLASAIESATVPWPAPVRDRGAGQRDRARGRARSAPSRSSPRPAAGPRR